MCGVGEGEGEVQSWPRKMSWNSRWRGLGEELDGRMADRHTCGIVGGRGRECKVKAQDEQTQTMNTMDGRTFTSRRTGKRVHMGRYAEERTSRLRGQTWAGSRLALQRGGTPTYSLPCTGVVVPLPAAALQLPLQPGQSLQPPMDVVSRWEVAWHRAEASLEADVLEIVQCRFPRGKRQLGAQQYRRLVAGAGLEHVVWLGSFLLEAGESSLPLLFAAPVGSGLDRELGLTEFGHCVLPLGMDLFHHCCLTDIAHVYCHLEASPECGGMEQ